MRSRPAWVVVTGALLLLGLGASPAYAQSPPTISKAFSAATVPLNQSATLTFTITNPNPATDLTNVSFNDNLPAGLIIANPDSLTPDPVVGDCDPTATTGEIDPTTTSISLSGGQIPASSSCTFSIDVLATATGTQVNTTDPISSSEGGTGGTATATIEVLGPPTMTVAFGAPALAPGDSTTLTFTLHNPNGSSSLSGLAFDDPLPAGLEVSTPSGASNTCGGALAATAGGHDVNLTSGDLSGNATCLAQVNVTATSATGRQDNSIAGADSIEGGTGEHAPSSIILATHPTASIGAPTSGQLFKLGAAASSRFACTEGTGGPGVSTCLDQAGHGSGSPIDTSSPGPHRLTVTATSADGFTGSASVPYQVAADPSVSITGPANGGKLTFASRVQSRFTCTEGAGGPGISSCLDQSGHASGTAIDTRAVGAHALTVTARSSDGFTATRTISYTVLANNHFTVSHVKVGVRGVVTFNVSLPGAGAVDVVEAASLGHAADRGACACAGSAAFASAHLHAHRAGTLHVKVKPNLFGRGLLTAHPGRVVLRLKVTFSPRGGVARSVTVRGVHVPKPRAKPKPKPKPPPIEDLRGAH